MNNFDKLHKKNLDNIKKHYQKEYSFTSEEEIRKNLMGIIKRKNFIETNILNTSYYFQDSEYNSFLW